MPRGGRHRACCPRGPHACLSAGGPEADPCTEVQRPLPRSPRIIGDAWRNGRAEVDVGQGMLAQVSPKRSIGLQIGVSSSSAGT